MKAFILVLLVTAGTDFYVMEPVMMDDREQCIKVGKKYADYKEQKAIEAGTSIKVVTFISCHEGTVFSRERPDMRD